MVTASHEQLRNDALGFFHADDLPDSLAWVEALSPRHLRLFAVELADAIKESALTGDLEQLAMVVESWEATAELDASPEVVARIRAPKDYRSLSSFGA